MKYVKYLLTVFMAGFLFVTCSDLSVSDNSKFENNSSDFRVVVKFGIETDNSRTALPDINWDDFTYDLIYVKNPGEADQGAAEIAFTDKSKNNLIQGIEFDVGKYKFTLKAKKNGKESLSGDVTVNLEENTVLNFRMFAVSGGSGSVSVKLYYPNDGTVGEIRAACSAAIFESLEGEKLKDPHFVAGEWEAEYIVKNIDSAKEKYILFWVYDKAGALIYSGAESLVIVNGCESKSEIHLTTADWHTYLCSIQLNKNGEGWTESNHKIKLVDEKDIRKEYNFTEGLHGEFTASVAEGIYDIYLDDTPLEVNGEKLKFNSKNHSYVLNYWSVSLAEGTKSVKLNPCAGIDKADGYANVLNGSKFEYELTENPGYEGTMVVKIGDVVQTEYVINSVTEPKVISISGKEPVIYTISFLEEDGSVIAKDSSLWVQGTVVPETYTVEDVKILPDLADIQKEGKIFDSWQFSTGQFVKSTEGLYENLVLTANWKHGVSIPDDEGEKWIYANGINLLVQWNSKQTKTEIYVDFNGDGVVNGPDYKIADKDFSGYNLSAGSMDGEQEYHSDFTFTMKGGIIGTIIGMGSDSDNKTTFNLSGYSKIGSVGELKKVNNSNGTVSYYTNEVSGIVLDTITDEKVTVNAAMNGDYKVNCITSRYFKQDDDHIIAVFNNKNFASMANFNCYTWDQEKFIVPGEQTRYDYMKQTLTKKDKYVNGVARTTVHLADPDGVSLPDASHVDGDVTDTYYGFSLGEELIKTNCSVFSVSVTNGTLAIGRETFTENKTQADKDIEAHLHYMVMPDASSYVDDTNYQEKNFPGSEHVMAFKNAAGDENRYIYLQIMSDNGTISSETASDFLAKMIFRRNGTEKMKIKVNLETVPAGDICPDGIRGLEGIITDEAIRNDHKVRYFDGSWYIRVNQAVNWNVAYNNAKKMEFNSLKGYLMNVTSLVENNYIFFQYNTDDAMSWFGASRYKPTSGIYDLDTYGFSNTDTYTGEEWKWQAGPEAGQTFWKSMVCYGASNTKFITDPAAYETEYAKAMEKYNEYSVEGMFSNWNNDYINRDLWQKHCEYERAPKYGSGLQYMKIEPNTTSLKGEPCAQFLSGKVNGGAENEYQSDGYWNDIKYDSTSGSNGSTAYFVEFTPYGDMTPDYTPITKVAEY